MNHILSTLLLVVAACAVPLGAVPLGAQQPAKREATRPSGNEPSQAAASNAVQQYFTLARRMWTASEHIRIGGAGHARLSGIFGAHVHCHVREWDPRFILKLRPNYTGIAANSAYGLCPSWLLVYVPPGVLNATHDGLYFAPVFADTLRAVRAALREQLARTVAQTPDDNWSLGQYVRFLVYDHLYDQALTALQSCGADPWLCAALEGYVQHARGDNVEADEAFARAHSSMTPDECCGLSDISDLLPERRREAYDAQPCEVRDALAQRYLWLADPAWVTRVNERRVTHFARSVTAMLHVSVERDERLDWRPAFGGQTVRELLIRYGRPSITTWIGIATDTGHTGYLKGRGAPPLAPYSTAEYAGPRYAFGAPGVLDLDETRAADTAWQIVAPPGQHAAHRSGTIWWPLEHMALPSTRVLPFTDWQLASFRRERDIQVAAAVDLREVYSAAHGATRTSDTLTLLISPEPDSIVTIATRRPGSTSASVLTGRMVPVSGVVSLELHGSSRGGVSGDEPTFTLGRVRRGYRAPAVLGELGRDSIALSDLVLFGASADLPRDINAMLPHMLPTVTVPRASVGVFWETYGVPVGDSVTFTVGITSRERPGFLRRAVAALLLMAAPANGVAIGWKDPADSGAASSGAAAKATPILPRAMLLDLSPLSLGEYVLELSAMDARKRTALATRVFRVK
jgi:hypothetical protein